MAERKIWDSFEISDAQGSWKKPRQQIGFLHEVLCHCRHNCCVTSKKLGSRDFKYISRSIQRICQIRFSVLLLKNTLFGMFLDYYIEQILFKSSFVKKKINWRNFFDTCSVNWLRHPLTWEWWNSFDIYQITGHLGNLCYFFWRQYHCYIYKADFLDN